MTKDQVILTYSSAVKIYYQLDVTYQRAFTASAKPSSVTKGYYQPSPARERFYDIRDVLNGNRVINLKNFITNMDKVFVCQEL